MDKKIKTELNSLRSDFLDGELPFDPINLLFSNKLTMDTAHDEISKNLQKKKNIGKEQADEEAGKILSAAKSKKGNNKKKETKIDPNNYEIQNQLGNWVNADKDDIKAALFKNQINESEFTSKIEKGVLYYASEWYAKIRRKPSDQQKKEQEKKLNKIGEESLKYQENERKRMKESVHKYERW